jgi:gamma-glutamylcyclotransferase
MTDLVFAYGSNMCSGRIRDYGISPVGNGRAALLEGYSLEFSKPSIDGSGKATVSLCTDDLVWGVLYEIQDTDLPHLDRGEGSGYGRSRITVRIDGSNSNAWIYIAKEPIETGRLFPYPWYKRFLVEGAREHRLPVEYITFLQALESIVDTDLKRVEDKEAILCSIPV